MMPAPMMAATQAPATSRESKPSSTGRAPSALAQDAHRRLGDDAELALRAGDQAEQVVAGASRCVAADLDHRAVDQHHRHAEQVVGGDAVFQAMRAARVHADVAGDGAGELARRIGRVEEALMRDRAGDAEIGDARSAPGRCGCRSRCRARGSSSRRRRRRRPPAAGRRPASEVPAPRGTTGTPLAWQTAARPPPPRSSRAARRRAACAR